MKALLDHVLQKRALDLFGRLRQHLPDTGMALDVGSGTGHNAACIEAKTSLTVIKVDVTDVNTVGRPVLLYDGRNLPFGDQTFDAVLALFMLHYVPDPAAFLRELGRTASGCTLLIQSVYTTPAGRLVLTLRELLQGRAAFHLARAVNAIPAARCAMQPLRFFNRDELAAVIAKAGMRIEAHVPCPWRGLGVSRDLYVLRSRSKP